MIGSGGATPAEQHLGDHLAALVDGELGHDTRERVLAHLATCPRCKAEADAQRELKNVFAETAPPAPSEGLLARLQGLAGGGDDSPGGPFGGSGLGNGVFGVRSEASFAYLPPSERHAPTASAGGDHRGGFRIHDVERSASRGRRFAFVTAGAVSLAALALGGALPREAPSGPSGGLGDDPHAAAPSMRSHQATSGLLPDGAVPTVSRPGERPSLFGAPLAPRGSVLPAPAVSSDPLLRLCASPPSSADPGRSPLICPVAPAARSVRYDAVADAVVPPSLAPVQLTWPSSLPPNRTVPFADAAVMPEPPHSR